MGVGILQHKGNINKVNKLKSSAIRKNPCAYRIGTPQICIILISDSGPYCGARRS
jgi:hypothetical protein